MNYVEQQSFLRKYKAIAVAVCAALVATAFYSHHTSGISIASFLLLLGTQYALVYLPKYLGMTIEGRKKYAWSVRIRWILAALLLVWGLFVSPSAFMAGVVIILFVNLAVRVALKRAMVGWWVGLLYLATDLVALSIIFHSASLDPLFKFLAVLFVAHLAVQLRVPLPFPLAAGFIHLSIYSALHALFVCASWWMTRMAARQARENLKATINELSEFTAESREEVEELLATSTARLAADWRQKRPQSREEVEAWYAENAAYYIYDLAQFHLAYKHITFTMDVMSLAKGRVLDYGGGIGDLSVALAERGCDVTYLDVEGRSKQYARWQAERRGVKINFASTHQEIEGKVFDTIIVLDVLEHLYEPEGVLEFLIERLAEDGVIILSAYFGATEAHPMHFDHKLDVKRYLSERGFVDAKGLYVRLFGSESMRRDKMYVLRKSRNQPGLD